jgi:colanic acid/amylovoran biosynthesis glycosyltransferase
MKPLIAYLAPEIPAIASPYVYREILALRKKGFDVQPVSVYSPSEPETGETAGSLSSETVRLYEMGILSFLLAAFICKLLHPVRYARTFFMLLIDMFHVGFFSRRSADLLYRFLAATRLARIMENHGCRHLHAYFADVPTDIAMYAAPLAAVSFSFTSRSSDLYEEKTLLARKVSRSAKAVTISEYNRNLMISLGVDEGKIAVIHSGVDFTRFGGSKSTRCAAVSTYPVIGSLGRLVEKKGFDILIRTANLMVREGLKFRIEIAGDGPWKDRLEQMVRYAGVFDRVTFIGAISNDLVPAWLAQLDLFVLACQIDGNGEMDCIPLPLVEALAAKVPVVSTRLTAIPELIESGVSGILVRYSDPVALAEAAWSIIDNEDVKKSYIEAGRRKVEAEYSEDTNIDKLAALLAEIITQGLR